MWCVPLFAGDGYKGSGEGLTLVNTDDLKRAVKEAIDEWYNKPIDDNILATVSELLRDTINIRSIIDTCPDNWWTPPKPDTVFKCSSSDLAMILETLQVFLKNDFDKECTIKITKKQRSKEWKCEVILNKQDEDQWIEVLD